MTALPPGLAARPSDPRRGCPVPFANVITADGECDYTSIDGEKSLRCARDRLCGLCELPLGYWIAFLGGEQAAQSRAYTDPPMHPDCAETAMRICPYIVNPGAARRTHPITSTGQEPPGWIPDRPARFVLYLTRAYKWRVTSRGHLIYTPAPAKELRTQP